MTAGGDWAAVLVAIVRELPGLVTAVVAAAREAAVDHVRTRVLIVRDERGGCCVNGR